MKKLEKHQLAVKVWDEDKPVFKTKGSKEKVKKELNDFWGYK